MAKKQTTTGNNPITGKKFDSPFIIQGGGIGEPEIFLAEKPYELSRFEYSVLKKGKYVSHNWSNNVFLATIGLFLALLGKTISALIGQQTPSIDCWEILAIVAGGVIGLILRFRKKSDEEKEFDEVGEEIDQHFAAILPRRVHVTRSEKDDQ